MMKKMNAVSRALLLALACAQLTCHQVILTAPPGSELLLVVNPMFIPAHGGVAVVTAVVVEPLGTPVPDGTVVQFFTNLGRIDEQGRTNDGVARVNLISDSRSGQATITAISGSAVDNESVEIGGRLPADVIVTAQPPRILLSVSRTTHIIATVVDADGNPVPNVQVVFRLDPAEQPNTTEFIENPNQVTDNNGRAEAILRTTRPVGSPPTVITVEVLTLSQSGATGEVDVPIQ